MTLPSNANTTNMILNQLITHRMIISIEHVQLGLKLYIYCTVQLSCNLIYLVSPTVTKYKQGDYITDNVDSACG